MIFKDFTVFYNSKEILHKKYSFFTLTGHKIVKIQVRPHTTLTSHIFYFPRMNLHMLHVQLT